MSEAVPMIMMVMINIRDGVPLTKESEAGRVTVLVRSASPMVPNTELGEIGAGRLTAKTMREQSHEDYVPFTAKVWELKGFSSNMGRSKYERNMGRSKYKRRRWKWRGNYAGEGEHLMAARQGDSWC